MHWELWDTESGNLIEEFDTEEDGLRGARDVLAVNTPDFTEYLALGAVRAADDSTSMDAPPVLRGAALVERIGHLPPSRNNATPSAMLVSTVRHPATT